jgi:hypothetical protein
MNFKNNHEYAFTGLEAAIVLIAGNVHGAAVRWHEHPGKC